MINNVLHKYLQYSKRIAIFGIVQWAVLAFLAMATVGLAKSIDITLDEYAMRIVNNIITCSSALAIAICSGYYAHSAYDNNLKNRVSNAFSLEDVSESMVAEDSSNG